MDSVSMNDRKLHFSSWRQAEQFGPIEKWQEKNSKSIFYDFFPQKNTFLWLLAVRI